MHEYQSYFENLLSRSWLGAKKLDKDVSLAKTTIEEVYFELGVKDKLIILGKTEKYFFILEGLNSDGFYYSNGLFNDDMKSLINAYGDKQLMLQGASVEEFVSSIVLFCKLERDLPTERIEKVRKLKI